MQAAPPTGAALADLHASFLRHLRAAKKADRTLVLYGQAIRFFSDWLVEQGRPATLGEFTRHNIEAWLAHLAERVAVETVRTRLRGLRRFSRWLVIEGEVDRPPTEGIEMPARIDTPPPVLRIEQVRALLKLCQVPKGRGGVFSTEIFRGRRSEVILRLLADCGLRVSELVGLTLDDVDLSQEVVFVVGKGSRPRAVPFSARTAQAIDRYLRMRRLHRYANNPRLLLSERGALTADGVRDLVKQMGRSIGLDGLHPHQFRHTNAHNWLAAGGQERDLKMLMGWRSDAMLEVYGRSAAVERSHAAHRRMALGDDL